MSTTFNIYKSIEYFYQCPHSMYSYSLPIKAYLRLLYTRDPMHENFCSWACFFLQSETPWRMPTCQLKHAPHRNGPKLAVRQPCGNLGALGGCLTVAQASSPAAASVEGMALGPGTVPLPLTLPLWNGECQDQDCADTSAETGDARTAMAGLAAQAHWPCPRPTGHSSRSFWKVGRPIVWLNQHISSLMSSISQFLNKT